MKQFNANISLVDQLRTMIQSAGIVLPKPSMEREKMMGFMGSRGQYTVGDCVIDTYGHYNDENDDRHYSLKSYKGKDTWWHLFANPKGEVYFSPTGCFNTPVEALTDFEPTPFVIE